MAILRDNHHVFVKSKLLPQFNVICDGWWAMYMQGTGSLAPQSKANKDTAQGGARS